MALIDSNGRIFGKANAIDVAVVGLLVGLVALAIGALQTFRPPVPKIVSITPNQIVEQQRATLQLTGEGIRPFLEVQFGDVGSGGLMIDSQTSARVAVPELPAGTYDVTVLDKGRRVFKMPGALTVVGERWATAQALELQVLGSFVAVNAGEASAIAVGAPVSQNGGTRSIGTVVAVLPPTAETQALRISPPHEERGVVIKGGVINVPVPDQLRARAILRLRCTVAQSECRIGDAPLSQGKLMVLALPGAPAVRFQIDEVRPVDARPVFPPAGTAVATIKVRFVTSSEVISGLKAGDVDIPGMSIVAETDRAVLLQIGADRERVMGQVTMEGILRRTLQVEQPMVAVTATLRVPVVFETGGWTYKERPVKLGATFHFESIAGGMSGLIVDVSVPKL